ncbi:MAG: hypothetical protein J6J27_04230 [Alphaproteobacteria bacterium]|jgi:hypothetical protein|nr:hypothetical protein [Alphaproteobacteria bacterium]
MNNILFGIFYFCAFFACIYVAYEIWKLPISIAKKRGLAKQDVEVVKTLCYLSFLFGFPYIIALCMACFNTSKN